MYLNYYEIILYPRKQISSCKGLSNKNAVIHLLQLLVMSNTKAITIERNTIIVFGKYRRVISSRFPIGVPTKYKPGFKFPYKIKNPFARNKYEANNHLRTSKVIPNWAINNQIQQNRNLWLHWSPNNSEVKKFTFFDSGCCLGKSSVDSVEFWGVEQKNERETILVGFWKRVEEAIVFVITFGVKMMKFGGLERHGSAVEMIEFEALAIEWKRRIDICSSLPSAGLMWKWSIFFFFWFYSFS